MRRFQEAPGGKLLTRVDFNCPVDKDGEPLDDTKIRRHVETVREMNESVAVLLSHQSRPGEDDFTTLEKHAEVFQNLLEKKVKYVDGLFSSETRRNIKNANPGEVILLENVRFYSEEYMSMSSKKAAETHLVRKLSPLFDAYINDAFSMAHRSQPSIVGFPETLPAYTGISMEKELEALDMSNADRPIVFVLGGAKPKDTLRVIDAALSNKKADKILTSGVVGNLFADNLFGDKKGKPKDLLEKYDSIEIPTDFVSRDGSKVEFGNAEEKGVDIGMETINRYSEILEKAGTAVVNGPVGVYEEGFDTGTRKIFDAATEANFSVAGGGDTSAAIKDLSIKGFDHISSGGKAFVSLLAGEKLPALEALKE